VSSIVPSPPKKVTVASSPAGWLSIAGQALTFALVAASATVAGVVDFAAQTFAGVKTFTSTLIASAGIQVGALWNTNGTGASDVGVKVGVSTPDASVNASAKLWGVYTGIGGTEVLKLYVDKTGTMFGGGGVSSFLLGPTQVTFSGPALNAYVTGIALLGSVAGGSATDVSTRVGTGRTDAATDPSATLLDIATNVLSAPVSRAKFVGSGRLDQKGNDRASTIGNDTQHNPSGINTIASGATSVTILNSLVPDPATKKIRLNLTWRGDPGSRWWWTQTTGAITINLSSPAPANVSCDWELAGLL